MSYVLRAARPDDLPAIYDMARSTGGGFTNLPPDRAKLEAKLASASAAFSRKEDVLGDDMFLFMLEDLDTGEVRGTCQIFSCIGTTWPFYSYRIDTFAKYSKAFGRSISVQTLTLSTDHSGCSEVGGLFLDPGCRTAGAGSLLARSRYLFIRAHRARFAHRVVAELRGVIDEAGRSPFWDGLGRRFFDIGFVEADEFNAIHGNQFIADLMPRHPVYTTLLPKSAVEVMGVPHRSGRAAQRMLEKEGFAFENYIDIFDGGPTMAAATEHILTVRDAGEDVLVAIADGPTGGVESIVTAGRLDDFRACYGTVSQVDGGISLDPVCARALRATPGQTIIHVSR